MGKYLKKVWLIGTRDYLELIRTKAYWIGTLSIPVFVVGMGVVSAFATVAVFSRIANTGPSDIATPSIPETRNVAEERNRDFPDEHRLVLERIDVGKFLDALRSTQAKLEDPLLESLKATMENYSVAETKEFKYQTAKLITLPDTTATPAATPPIVQEFVDRWRTQPESLKALIEPAHPAAEEFSNRDPSAKGDTNAKAIRLAQIAAPVGFAMFLWFMIVITSSILMSNVVEEKSNRLFEVLLSSVSAAELMDGKTVGIAMSGLTTLGIWIGAASIFSLFGFMIPESFIGGLVRVVLGPELLIPFLFYFITGYLFYAALFSAIGASCNTVREAQMLSLPVTIVMAFFIVILGAIGAYPDQPWVVYTSYFPPLTPLAMMARGAGSPALWEYFTTGGVLLISLYFTRVLCLRVYEKGVLSFGPPPTFRQMASMLKESSS